MKEACAVVLAAGKGTRMKSDLPKVLCPVVGRPMIHFVLDALEKAGIHRHIVVVGHEAEMVEAEVKTRAGQTDFVLQSPQLGTGHAVQICRDVLAEQQGPTIVVAGDSPLIQPSVSLNFWSISNKPSQHYCWERWKSGSNRSGPNCPRSGR